MLLLLLRVIKVFLYFIEVGIRIFLALFSGWGSNWLSGTVDGNRNSLLLLSVGKQTSSLRFAPDSLLFLA